MLCVWMHGTLIATVEKGRHARQRLTYSQQAIEKYGLGRPLLSLALPVRPEKYAHGVTRHFLDGLLPEGEARLVIARKFQLERDDTYGLIEAIGRDCAGAIVIQPEGERPARATTQTAEPLDDEALAALVTGLKTTPLGVEGDVRISLGGVQEKLVLTRMLDGRWGKPVAGTPSTHILKPEIAGISLSVENEAFCMRLARALGLAVASVEVATVAGRKLLVVERYDRRIDVDGRVTRLHQEDFCQATGRSPEQKYEENGGPSLREIVDVLRTTAPDSVEPFLRALIVNVVIGNGDAHAKNFSLLHEQAGTLELTPLYDLMSTAPYGATTLAMHVDDVRQIAKVTGDRVVNEASRWGLSNARIIEVAEDLLERVLAAVEATRNEIPDVPDTIPALIKTQVENVRQRLRRR